MSVVRRKNPFNFRSWCQKELSKLIKDDIEDDLMDYLLSIESDKDVKEYLHDMLTPVAETRATRSFIEEFFRHWRPPERIPHSLSSEDKQLEVLVKPNKDEMVLFATGSKEKLTTPIPPGFKSGVPSNTSNMPSPGKVQSTHRRPHPKNTFVPLMSKEGQSRATMQLPGKHACQCLAQRHTLINNCIKCGRIVCSQEGSGPCIFCGALVCTSEEEEWFTKDSKKSKMLRDQFLKKHNIEDVGRPLDHIQRMDESKNLHKAEHHKEKLLDFDQTSTTRTRVIDDESDYFSVDTNSWLSVNERDILQERDHELREKKYGSRRNRGVVLDISGRKVIEEEPSVNLYDEQQAKIARSDVSLLTHAGELYNVDIPTDRPKFVEDKRKKKKSHPTTSGKGGKENKPIVGGRLQDNALQEMKDEGRCLSMHQPWASLLVAGIKKCEGRTWSSPHRGRLWIAATAQAPSDKDISQVHDFYAKLYEEVKEDLFFPLEYPTSCLLGSVNVLDCLSQEDYREKFPGGESESDYVFVIDNPQQLTVKFPIKGHHKIWKLERIVHLAAKAGLKYEL